MNPTNARVRSPPVRARRVWLALFLALACAWGAALLFRFSYPARRELIAAGDPGVAVGRESDADWRGAQSWQWLAQGWTRLAERIRNVAAPHGLQNVSASGEGAAVEVEGWMDMREAASRWEQQVGCAAFRRKHGGPEAHGQHTRRGPAAFPTNPSLQDVTSPPCASLTLSHVLVDVVQPGWLEPTGLDGFHVCPRCGITCQLAWNPSLLRASLPPHAQLFVHSPDAMPLTRPPASPLRVLLQLEADATLAAAKREGRVDVAVGYAARSEVQLTYVDVERSLKAGRQHLLAPGKRQDVPVHHASSNCAVPWRSDLLASLLPLLAHHSFGACSNNMGGSNREAALYPECAHPYVGEQRQEVAHCVKSHYKFDLAIENTVSPNYVTEKFYSALEAGTVPVYFGAPDIASFAPPESFIDGRQFATHQALADHINRLHRDPSESWPSHVLF